MTLVEKLDALLIDMRRVRAEAEARVASADRVLTETSAWFRSTYGIDPIALHRRNVALGKYPAR